MRAIIFNTREEAEALSSAEAIRRGCDGSTLFWYGVSEALDGTFVVSIPEDDIPVDAEGVQMETVDRADIAFEQIDYLGVSPKAHVKA